MKTLGPASLYTFLEGLAEGSQGAQLYCWDLFTISLTTGAVLRLTSADQDITMPGGAFSYSGHTFSAAGPYINRSMMKQSIGFSVDSCEITLTSPPGIQFGASPFLAAMAHGQFDGATVQVDRLFQRYWGDFSIGAQPAWFKGQVGAIDELDQAHCKFTINSKTELLNIQMPYNLYGPGCFHTLGDAGCTIDLATLTVTGTAQSGSTASVINTALSQAGPTPPPLIFPYGTEPVGLGIVGSVPMSGVNLAAPQTYYAVWTAVSANGESTPGPESSVLVKSRAFQVWVSAPNASGGVIGAYSSGTTYAAGAIVSSGGHYWESLYGSNVGHTPGSGVAWWIQLIGLNLYVGLSPGGEQLQAAGIGFTLNPWPFTPTFSISANDSSGPYPGPYTNVVWLENPQGLLQGPPPPLINNSGYFALGTIIFTSGQNQGVSRNVAAYGITPGAVAVVPPLPYVPAPGDTFAIYPGCARDKNTCQFKFNNLTNHGSTPYLPLPWQTL